MGRIDRDTVAAIVLVALTAVFAAATFAIRETSYGTVGSEVWPRAILVVLGALCLIYLANALRGRHAATEQEQAQERERGLRAWIAHYRNALCCFAMYALFLVTLPYLGILLGGIGFVFILLTLLGGWQPRQLAVHAIIAVASVGAMWAIFTFALRVILPEGELLRIW